MDTADFDYDLPADRIAQQPVEPRDSARLLVDRGPGCPPADRVVADLPSLCGPGDVVVVNDTRVLPARLRLRRAGTGGAVEALLLEEVGERTWEALLRPSRRVRPGDLLVRQGLGVEVVARTGEGRWQLRFAGPEPVLKVLARHGEVPLPPYVTEALEDPERYQTVFARRPASAAAPTAGLHLTPAVLEALEARGATVARLELVVGLATFRPITAERVEDHVMHEEAYHLPPETVAALLGARRVTAVGTTVVRALEAWAATGQERGRTDLFIRGDHPFGVVDRLLTNFHVPRSSLLVLVEAFVGPRWRDLYACALERGYRFLSFGDAMLLERRRAAPAAGPPGAAAHAGGASSVSGRAREAR
ncbi:MAG: tRNA preQ1(34) S-adenosylmethionine ribosyltransferase-isomerase QueA [Acidimicrobiia bacterium]|nr:tRNA preQ1(34) S-adenosylmethionine ribosyltransferase-isomerase QueA [Acidimicrobiia bacterium]